MAVRLTTIDNPYDPFDQEDEWRAWDLGKGYYTDQFLARVAVTSDELSELDQRIAIETAIDEICKENVLGIYRKIVKENENVEI